MTERSSTASDYADLARNLHRHSESYADGHGPLHACAANAIEHLMTLLRTRDAAQDLPWRDAFSCRDIYGREAFEMTDKNSSTDIVERLRSTAQLPVCPYDRRSPDYWTTPDDKPCVICGQENTSEGPDKCRGADTRVMEEAAQEIERLRGVAQAAPKSMTADERWCAANGIGYDDPTMQRARSAPDRDILIDVLWDQLCPGVRQSEIDREYYGRAIDAILARISPVSSTEGARHD